VAEGHGVIRLGTGAHHHPRFLTADERGNPDTVLDRRHTHGDAWSCGNAVRPLVHGTAYFAELCRRVDSMRQGDLLLFTDWRGDPDQRLDGDGREVGAVFAAAASRGVVVRGLVWRSHLDRFAFSAEENRHLGEEIEAAGGQCLLDQRVRVLGSHHQKLVVLRHPEHEERDVAYVGGIDLCHSRRDDARHLGDAQRQPMAAVYGERPPWHDVQLEMRGPAVGDAETVFRERWTDPAPLTRNPWRLAGERLRHEDRRARPLPAQLPDPSPVGPHCVQLLRTYPQRRPGYPFARHGERSLARAYAKVLAGARRLVYVEDQYLWSMDVARVFADALRRAPDLRMVFVIPRFPDQDGRTSMPPNLAGRAGVLRLLHEVGGDRVSVFGVENQDGVPIYVHAKVCVVDDVWMCVGSDNANRRSWTHDSELSAAVQDLESDLPRRLRIELAAEHLGFEPDDERLEDARSWSDAFRDVAADLDAWHSAGRIGPRPPGQLRRYTQPPLSVVTRLWADPLYRAVYDPDGRSPTMRLRRRF
jgi:phosphatidylserine/phosphatidylglycerophosphate/cardiolipin synthase-like enzyme